MQRPADYDSDLRMYRAAPRPLDVAHLRFLRWLADRGRLEHAPAGPPSGDAATAHYAVVPTRSSAVGGLHGSDVRGRVTKLPPPRLSF
jgi:hypothetical protein